MSASGFNEFISALRLSLRDLSPDFTSDVNDKGEELLLVTVRNPHNPYWGVSYEAFLDKDGHIRGSLWFGQCEVTGFLAGEQAEAAIRSVTSGEITAVVRYKTDEDLEDRHPSGWQRVFQVLAEDDGDDDRAALDALLGKLRSKPTFLDGFDRNTLGVFEVAVWNGVTVIRRTKTVKK